MRVVLDTNVLFAGFAARGLCEAVVETCIIAHDLIISEYILSELSRHLASKLRLPTDRLATITALLRDHSQCVDPTEVSPEACRDPADLAVLGTAVAGAAERLVTGHRDLLDLRSYEGIPIVTPRAFHDALS